MASLKSFKAYPFPACYSRRTLKECNIIIIIILFYFVLNDITSLKLLEHYKRPILKAKGSTKANKSKSPAKRIKRKSEENQIGQRKQQKPKQAKRNAIS